MIHFDFVVDDIDAENIMGCFQTEINKCNDGIMETYAEIGYCPKAVEVYKSRIRYLKELITKMHNSRVEE
jgi:hypothetical protein